MIVAGFVEGAPASKGGIGLVGVPPLLRGLASRGHKVLLVMASPPVAGWNAFHVEDVDGFLRADAPSGAFGIVVAKAKGSWAFSPEMFRRFDPVVRAADFVSLHSLYSFPVLAGYLMARRHGKPYGIWPHGVLAPFQRQVGRVKKRVYDKLFANSILNNASAIFFNAPGESAEASDLLLRAPSVVIPHGLNLDDFAQLPSRGSFRTKFLGGHQGPLVLFLARLNAKKGIDLLVDAMKLVVARYPAARLALVGPPDPVAFGAKVREWVARSGISANIVMTGAIGPATRLQAFADADLLVQPSYAENFGYSVFEAMASRVPVVVSDTLNYAAEIANHGAGIAVVREPVALAAAIVELLEQPERRKSMGERGAHLAREYSWDKYASTFEGAITEILRDRAKSCTLPANGSPRGPGGRQEPGPREILKSPAPIAGTGDPTSMKTKKI